MSLRSLSRAGSRSRRLVVCGAAAALVLLPGVAQAETTATDAPAASSISSAPATGSPAATDSSAPVSSAPVSSTPADSSAPVETSAPVESTAPASTSAPAESTTPVVPSTSADPTTPAGSAAPVTAAPETTEPGTTEPGTTEPETTEPETTEGPTGVMSEMDPAELEKLFTPVCASGELTGLTLQVDQLTAMLDQLKAMGVPVPDDVLPAGAPSTVAVPLDDATLTELTDELNAESAQFADLGLTDADIQDALADLPANIRDDFWAVLQGLQAGDLQPAEVRALLMDLFPCPVEAPAPTGSAQGVTYLGYAPTGGNGSDGGAPIGVLGGGAVLLAGAGLLTASSLRSRAARARG